MRSQELTYAGISGVLSADGILPALTVLLGSDLGSRVGLGLARKEPIVGDRWLAAVCGKSSTISEG